MLYLNISEKISHQKTILRVKHSRSEIKDFLGTGVQEYRVA